MTRSRLFISSLEKGLRVLSHFRNYESLSLNQIAKLTGMNLSSVQRIMYTLEELGYVNRSLQNKDYHVGPKTLDLSFSYLAYGPLFQKAHAILQQLYQECGESINFSVPDNNTMVYTMRIHTFKHIPIYMPPGTRIPMVSSASGRAILAQMSLEDVNALLAKQPVNKHTTSTVTDMFELKRLIEEARENGY